MGGGGGVLVDAEHFFLLILYSVVAGKLTSDHTTFLIWCTAEGGGGGEGGCTQTLLWHTAGDWRGWGGGEVTGGHGTVIWLTLGWGGIGEVLLYRHTRPAFSSITSLDVTVPASLFQSEKILSFVPPDGHFRLMSYHIGSNKWVLKRKEEKKKALHVHVKDE